MCVKVVMNNYAENVINEREKKRIIVYLSALSTKLLLINEENTSLIFLPL